MLPTPISEFLVAKLYPNDLVFIMDDMNSLPINRGHWLFVLDKKNSYCFKFFKREESLLALFFKVLSFAKVFSWFTSSFYFFTIEIFLTSLLEPKIISTL